MQDYAQAYGARLDALLAGDAISGRERLMRYWRAWLDDPGEEDPAGGGWAEDCLAVKLSAEVADLSETMRQILSKGIARLLDRIAVMITEARADGSLPAGPDPMALAQVLYQMWLGAALLAKLDRSRAPMERALAATEQLLACATEAGPTFPVITS